MLRALELFCGAGGATRGLRMAGSHITGIDIEPQPNSCANVFIQADALDYLRTVDLSGFDLVWASPPCQKFTSMRHAPGTKAHLDLITPTRELLVKSGKPYCIENVVEAPLRNPITLCGSMFDLKAPSGALRRHRLFETSFPLAAPCPCKHRGPTLGVYGAHIRDRRRPSGTNHKSGSNLPLEHAFIAMGVPVGSMTLAELSEAIPPAYSRHVAESFLAWAAGREAPPLFLRHADPGWQALLPFASSVVRDQRSPSPALRPSETPNAIAAPRSPSRPRSNDRQERVSRPTGRASSALEGE
jgi:DNA (cytosine-5)-methyltransferase 1